MNEDKRPKNNINLNKYEDPTGLAAKNLDFGLWIAKNRRLIYKILVILLASAAAGFLLYSGYGYFYYFVFGKEQDLVLDQSSTSGVDLANYRLQNKPVDLLTGQAKVIATNVGSDFVVDLKNPNDKQMASFDYCFTVSDNKACSSSFILPSDEKNILLVNSPIKTSNGAANFELSNVKWQKINAGQIPNWNSYQKEHSDFTISEAKFSSYDDSVVYLEFDITNNSSYGYFEVPLNITINQGDNVLAVNRYVVKDVSSREKKTVRISWPEAAGLGGTIKIVPDLNIVDYNIYKPYHAN